jgi:O-antigen/teichoic acid export membrane protein
MTTAGRASNPMFVQLFGRYRRILQDSAWVAGSLGLTAVMNLVGTRAITHFLSPALFGQVNLLQNLALLLRNLFCFPILNAAPRFYSEAAREGDVDGLRRMLTLSLGRAMLMMQIILLAIGGYLYWRRQTSLWIPLALAFYLLFDVGRTFEVALFNGARRQRPPALIAVLENLLRPLFIVGAVILFSARAEIVLAATAASLLVPLVITYSAVRLEGMPMRHPKDPICAPDVRRFARQLIPYALLMWITSVSDRYIIDWFSSDTARVGIYAAGYGLISQPFIMINTVISLTLRPVYFAQVSSHEWQLSRRTFRVWLMVSSVFCVGGLVLAILLRHWVVSVFLAPKYAEAAIVVPWIALGYLFYVIQQVLEQHLMAHKRTGAILWVQAIAAAASILITIPLVARFGMVGAAYACPIYFLVPCVLTAQLIYSGGGKQREHANATNSS